MRAVTLLSKAFLHHLSSLLTLPTFSRLWLRALELLQSYLHAPNNELLVEEVTLTLTLALTLTLPLTKPLNHQRLVEEVPRSQNPDPDPDADPDPHDPDPNPNHDPDPDSL